jgi:hypothetical protein
MLSSLRKAGEMNMTLVDNRSLRPSVRQELRILVALATVLVRNHEVVAVAALRSERPHQREDLQTIVCTRSLTADHDEDQPNPPQMSRPKLNPFWRLFTTGNYRRDKDESKGSLGGRGRDTLRSQYTPIVPMNGTELQKSYITPNAYVQFNNY